MKTRPDNSAESTAVSTRGRAQSARVIIALLACGCLLAFVALWWPRQAHQINQGQPGLSENTSAVTVPARSAPPNQPRNDLAANQQRSHSQVAYQQPEPAPALTQLVNSLVEGVNSPLTQEQALAWRTNLQSLIQQGAEAIPAISEFLAKNMDLTINPDDRKLLGYSSVRSAMLDALAQIGGPAAVNAMAQVLQSAADPNEIAFLGQALEKMDPGVHGQEVFNAAREALGMAADGKLPGRDVAPLFEVLGQFGGANAIADLQNSAKQWNFYAMMGLARLPDGAGVPSIVQMAEASGGTDTATRTAALQMLVQVAGQWPDAREALTEQVRQNKLSPYDWATLAPFLAGEQMVYQNSAFVNSLAQVNPNDLRKAQASANQSFLTAPLGALTVDQIQQQTAFLDKLLAVASNPAAVQTLQQAKTSLANRAFQTAATAGN